MKIHPLIEKYYKDKKYEIHYPNKYGYIRANLEWDGVSNELNYIDIGHIGYKNIIQYIINDRFPYKEISESEMLIWIKLKAFT